MTDFAVPTRITETVDRSTLLKVVAVAGVRESPEVQIEMHSLEIREAGGFGALRVEDRRESAPIPPGLDVLPPGFGDLPPSMDLVEPRILLADDAGTQFTPFVFGADSTSVSWRVRFVFMPAPAPGARYLDVTIERFGEAAEGVVGPWSFRCPL